MAIVNDIIKIMQEFAPENLTAPNYEDNVGLLIGDKNQSVQNIYCCLDLTNKDIDKAIAKNAQMVICHHPLMYNAIQRITTDTVEGGKIIRLIKNNIAVYAAHTNLDFVEGGLNEYAAKQLGLKNLRPMDPYISQGAGAGRIGELDKAISLAELSKNAASVFGDPRVDAVGDPNKKIKTIAIINGGGSGIGWMVKAKEMGADCFISGDMKQHEKVYAADADFPVIDASHYHTENIFIPQLAKILIDKTKGLNVEIHY